LLTKNAPLAEIPKEKILITTLFYFNTIKNSLPDQWEDIKSFRLSHVVSLNALAMAGNEIISLT